MATQNIDTGANSVQPSADMPRRTHTGLLPADRFGGYDGTSITLHWLVAALIVTLLATLAPDDRSAHVSLGLIATPFLAYHVFRRLRRGFARPADEPVAVSLVFRLAVLTMLGALFVLILTGLVLPLADGSGWSVFGVPVWSAPWSAKAPVAATLRHIHDAASTTLVVSIGLHLIAALAHAARGMHHINARIFRAIDGGR